MKRLCILLLAAFLAVSATGCAENNENSALSSLVESHSAAKPSAACSVPASSLPANSASDAAASSYEDSLSPEELAMVIDSPEAAAKAEKTLRERLLPHLSTGGKEVQFARQVNETIDGTVCYAYYVYTDMGSQNEAFFGFFALRSDFTTIYRFDDSAQHFVVFLTA